MDSGRSVRVGYCVSLTVVVMECGRGNVEAFGVVDDGVAIIYGV